MTAACLFRGHAHREQAQIRPWGIDWRRCVETHWTHLIRPLSDRFGGCDVFLSSYATPHQAEILRDYCPVDHTVWATGGEQKDRLMDGLAIVQVRQLNRVVDGFESYDVVACCRFDLNLKMCPLDYGVFDKAKVCFLWREWNAESWANHRRVPDPIQLIPGEFVQGFLDALCATPSRTCMHTVYWPLAKVIGEGNIHIQNPEGFVDSNTDHCPNPVYDMVRVK